MFQQRKARTTQKRLDSLIGAGTTVDGDVAFTGGLRIDGTVHGKVSTLDNQPGTLVLSERARIEGEVRVSHVVINGTVAGPVTASDHLELQAKAQVHGDVVYRTLEMHVGAVVEGKLSHSSQETAEVVALKRATAE
ncbi:MAG TPA: polymer-forming cytoskeletal protein [Casimicrobiaceae bacterium]|nr:polymer-forming cytoskeletal protein [Casimicrobiaceae bacterium]